MEGRIGKEYKECGVYPCRPLKTQGERLIEQRRQANLCFKCGDRYFPEHQCKKQLFPLDGEEDHLEEEEVLETNEEGEEDNGEISLHALKGLVNNKIIKVEGRVGECKLMILIDSGRTHSFIDDGQKVEVLTN